MRTVVCAVVLALVAAATSKPLEQDIDHRNNEGPEPLPDYISSFGYPVETHEITTADGYVLTYYRIPGGKGNTTTGSGGGRPVLLMHGLTAVSSVWVSVQDSLGFVLADAGFDVWLGNARGTTFSRKHVEYDPDNDKKKFWEFSWHEMGYYDLPAAIDYILETTGHSQVQYAGHSMGTTMFMVLGATRPEYMTKVTSAVLMAPVAYITHAKSPIIRISVDFLGLIVESIKLFGMYEMFPFSNTTYRMEQTICGNKNAQFLCRDLVFSLCGFDSAEINQTLFTSYIKYIPGGTSYKALDHYGQVINKAKFQHFDYGLLGNLMHYKSRSPPLYDLSKVKAPVHIFYGDNDWLATPEDVMRTAGELPDVVQINRVDKEKWSHIDFMFGSDARSLVYDPIAAIFQSTDLTS